MAYTDYLHILDGRLRIKVPEVKRSPEKALQVEETLQSLNGVTHVKANPTTGNVLVLFESELVTHECVVSRLKSIDCFNVKLNSPHQSRAGIGDVLVRSITELLLERAIVALL
jgi:copper chaperone CopZ